MKIRSYYIFIIYLVLITFISALNTRAQEQKPELVVQTGHQKDSEIVSLAFSLDDKLLASAGQNVVKIWEVEANKELRSINTGGFEIEKMAFNSNGQGILTAGLGRITLWEVASGNPLWTISDVERPISFSADGTLIAAKLTGIDGITILDSNTGRKLRQINGSISNLTDLALSPDNKLICVSGYDGELQIQDAVTGSVIRSLPKQDPRIDIVRFSPNGNNLLLTAGAKVSIWNVAAGKMLRTFSNTLEINSGKIEDNVSSIAFSYDDQIIAILGTSSKLNLWDTATGKQALSFEYNPDGVSRLESAAFSHHGKIVAGSAEGTIFLWDLATKKIRSSFRGFTRAIEHVAYSPKNNAIVSISEMGFNNFGNFGEQGIGRSVSLWSSVGQNFSFLKGRTDKDTSVFSQDGNSLLTIERIEQNFSIIPTITEWNINTSAELKTFPKRTETGLFLLNPDSKSVAVIDTDAAVVQFFDVLTGKQISKIGGQKERLASYGFSPDGKFFAASSLDKTIKVWNVLSGKLIQTFNGIIEANGLAFNREGTLLAAQLNDSLKILQISDGKEVFTIENILANNGGINNSGVVFSLDNRLIAVTTRKMAKIPVKSPTNDEKDLGEFIYQISLIDAVSGKLALEFKGDYEEITSIAFSPDGKFLVSGGKDAQTKLWDVKDGKELAKLITINDKEWLVVTPEGLFDGSPSAWKQLIWRFDNNTFNYAPVEAYFNDFFYPNLLQEIMLGKRPLPPDGKDLSKIDRRTPHVAVSLNDAKIGAVSTAAKTVKVKIEVSANIYKPKLTTQPANAGAQDLRLFRNGSLVKIWHGDVLKDQKSIALEGEVPVVAGENVFTAYAFNRDNVKSEDSTFTIKGADELKRAGTLYVLAIGINKYENPAYNLNFAVADVTDIGNSIKLNQDKLSTDAKLKQYSKTEIITLTDENATKSNIMLALNRFSDSNKNVVPAAASDSLKQELQKIKPTMPEDALIIYYAGHGTSKGERFYLLPHNFAGKDENSLVKDGISDIELNEVLEKVDAGKLLMAIDACQSGQALGKEGEGRAPMNSKGLTQLAYDKGMLILTAAQSQQAALESVNINGKEIKHGLLTYALLEGLTANDADKDHNKQLWEREWLDFAVGEVPQLQLEAMKQRHQDVVDKKRGAEILYVNNDKATDPNKRGLQTPRIFYRREAERNPMVIAEH